MNEEPRDTVIAAARRAARDLLDEYPRLRVVLFGSRVAGTGDARSDFDVGFDAGVPLPLDQMARLRELFDDLPILQTVDVVDLAAADERFRRIAARNEEVLLER
jgi:predicted nucleotidyltransferase